MMKWIALAVVAALMPTAQEGSLKADELLARVAAGLKDKPIVVVETEMHTRIQSLTVSQKAKVMLKRPNLARMEIRGAGQDAVIVLDGSNLWHFLKPRNRYVRSKQLGTSKLEQYGAGLAAPLFFGGGVESIKAYLAGATLGEESLDGRSCRVVTWTVGAQEEKVWIEGDRLRQVRATRSLGGESVEQTIIYGDWTFPATLDESRFTFSPPEGCELLASKSEERLLGPGSPLPEVAALDLQGNPVRLSAYKGRPLLLAFWFHG
jgi:outer membrane lipoprotein-sorting protein